MEKAKYTDVLKIRDAVARARESGMDISEYTLRRAIRSGQLPCRVIGSTYLISWLRRFCQETVSYTHLTLPTILRV